jgi:aldehyde dehydrogenase (NAD+)
MGIASRRTVRREAVGVVAAITPWNVPTQINLAKVGPALAAGCTVVLKPAPDTPWLACELGRLVAERTDIPAGVFNVVTPLSNEVAAQLTVDPRVDMVSFTGSTATGKAIMAAAAPTLKRVFLELGGKSAAIVLDDADVAAAAGATAFAACIHAGQGCALTTRLIVPRDRYDEAVQVAATTMESIGASDPADPNAICGPVISQLQRDRVAAYLDLATAEGGTFATGGSVIEKDGYWVQPTVVAGLDNSSRLAQEAPFGGYKQSGLGREMGIAGFEEYLETKTIAEPA